MNAVVGLVLAAIVGLAGCRDEQGQASEPIRPVLSVVAVERTTDTLGPFAGTIEPRYKTDLGFRIFGRMVARFVDIGSVVKKGEELAALDPAVQEAGVRSARAAVANAQAQYNNAEAEEGRQRDLVQRNYTPPADFELVERNRDTADANLKRAEAQLAKAQDLLSFTRLIADFDGVITGRYAEPGQVVNPGQKVLTLARPDVREAVIAVPSGLAEILHHPNDLAITVHLDKSLSIMAAGVRAIDPVADPNTRTQQVYLSLADPPDAFRLGITIAVTMTRSVSPRVDLPATALLDKDGKTYVWVVDPANTTVDLRQVTVASRSDHSTSRSDDSASRSDASVTVTAGIRGGERVVIAGVHSLSPGQKVKLQ
ncbi:MAG: efflux RND transporter periplasmic adaptor subunit [Alphaproteobacteria bacterium]|nr:efflux RND transporter periplasmic adaptor subunit [Alphaproteobacteria bacterium]